MAAGLEGVNTVRVLQRSEGEGDQGAITIETASDIDLSEPERRTRSTVTCEGACDQADLEQIVIGDLGYMLIDGTWVGPTPGMSEVNSSGFEFVEHLTETVAETTLAPDFDEPVETPSLTVFKVSLVPDSALSSSVVHVGIDSDWRVREYWAKASEGLFSSVHTVIEYDVEFDEISAPMTG